MSLKIPRPGLGADRVLLTLWENGPMAIADLAKAANVKIDNLMSIAHEYKLRTPEVGMYALPQSYVVHFNQCRLASEPQAAVVVTPPRMVNIWTPEMTGYAASLSRRIGRQA